MELIPPPEVTGNTPATYVCLQGGLDNIGFIRPVSSHFCKVKG
jgi:molybdenum cofactor biosynthesis enzyme MoaA